MAEYKLIPYSNIYQERSINEMIENAHAFRTEMQGRRSVRDFSEREVPKQIIEECLITAGSAPSGANKQPWHFVVVSDLAIKRKIKEEAEKNEKEFYYGKASVEWLNAIAPLNTTEKKPFLELAPYLILIFAEKYKILPGNVKEHYYYVSESVGIATGILVTALHKAGLATLTYTPSPMNFLNKLLNRPESEKAYLLL
jgi:iodotyrosine deiodinase